MCRVPHRRASPSGSRIGAEPTSPARDTQPTRDPRLLAAKVWDGVYGVGAPAAVRLYLATIGSGDDRHLFVVGLEGEDEALARLTQDAAPIIASIRVPASFPIW